MLNDKNFSCSDSVVAVRLQLRQFDHAGGVKKGTEVCETMKVSPGLVLLLAHQYAGGLDRGTG